jgi:DNA/RNA endonuclease YhcR with UshA esterase domain
MLHRASFKLVSVVALIVTAMFLSLNAQTPAMPKYAKSSEVKVKGVVDEVKTATDGIVHLTLKTDKGSLDVVIAPEKFLKEMEITFAKGDALEVLGSQVASGEATVLLAREVTRSGEIMMMRDETGKPVWVGWPK